MRNEQPINESELREQRNGRIFLLAAELSRNPEPFPFPELEADAYTRIIAIDREYPGLTTPIDEIIARCRAEGIRVVFGKNPDTTNVYILPAKSTDIENDSIVPKTLSISPDMDDRLRELIQLDRAR